MRDEQRRTFQEHHGHAGVLERRDRLLQVMETELVGLPRVDVFRAQPVEERLLQPQIRAALIQQRQEALRTGVEAIEIGAGRPCAPRCPGARGVEEDRLEQLFLLRRRARDAGVAHGGGVRASDETGRANEQTNERTKGRPTDRLTDRANARRCRRRMSFERAFCGNYGRRRRGLREGPGRRLLHAGLGSVWALPFARPFAGGGAAVLAGGGVAGYADLSNPDMVAETRYPISIRKTASWLSRSTCPTSRSRCRVRVRFSSREQSLRRTQRRWYREAAQRGSAPTLTD